MVRQLQPTTFTSKDPATAAFHAFIKASAIPMKLIAHCRLNEKEYEIWFNKSTSKNGIHYRAVLNTRPHFTFWYSRLHNGTRKFTSADCAPQLKTCLIEAIDKYEASSS